MKYFSNKDVAQMLREISAAYAAKEGDRFKIIAYDNAADSVEHATSEAKDLWEEGKLDSLPGLGKGIQSHLDELFKTGKVKRFEELKKDLPPGMFYLLKIPGMGPKSAFKIAKALKIKDVDDLEAKAKAGKIRRLPGFGQKSEADIIKSIAQYKARSDRYPLPLAFANSEEVIKYLKESKEVQDAQPLGSLRRMVATIGDVDIAISSKNPKAVLAHFNKYKQVSRILTWGSTASSVVLKNGVQVDVKVQPSEAFGALLQHFTGSKNHNIHLRELALKKGLSLSEYGIKKGKTLHKFKTEEKFYKFLGLAYIEPELREDTGEIEAAQKNELPNTVKIEDIKGDIHLHSNYPIEPSHDLGKNSFAEIVKKGQSLGYQYVGLSDHSPGHSTHTKTQIVEMLKKRRHEIEKIKSSNPKIRILNLLEIDILINGQLSVPEEGLKLLDGSIAGIHSGHSQDKKRITERLFVACRSPYVQVISHPTGRLLLHRESYEADWPLVYKECARTGTMLEINAWPNRLDLPDVMVKEAINAGVKLIINTDSHKVEQMDMMRFGVAVAKRGWAAAGDIANTLPWLEFKKLFAVS